jgi:hypothetical protein
MEDISITATRVVWPSGQPLLPKLGWLSRPERDSAQRCNYSVWRDLANRLFVESDRPGGAT